ncbi:MAG: peptidylprolyl isomerase [Melioribacteraceae bacterium]|nr:MAG: peptidylprolyl isomerase [Melioribacteraceae bacterium]
MKWQRIHSFLVSFVLLTIIASGQTNQDFVAKIGDEFITTDHFKIRYEFTPHVGRHIGSAKKEFAITLIAEKMWAEKARELGYDTNPAIASTLSALKKMFIRDKLYRDEILANVIINDQELADAVNKHLSKLQVQYLRSTSKSEIDNLHYLLSSGYSFDLLLVDRPEVNDPQNNALLSYTDMNQFVVDSLYKLNVGEFTKPISVGTDWFVFQVNEKTTQFFPNAEGRNSVINSAREKLKDDKVALLYKDFMQKMFVGKDVKVNRDLFRFVARQFSEVLKAKPNLYDTLFIDSNDAYYITLNAPKDTLDLPFIEIGDSKISVGDFILELAFHGFETISYEIPIVEKNLNSKIRQFIEYEVLAQEGIKRGYADLPEVQSDINMWEDYYLSYFYKKSVRDSITYTTEELREFISTEKDKSTSYFEYNAIELLTDDLNLIGTALNIEDTDELKEFAVKHTIRERVKNNQGDLGWFSDKDFPELSKIADELQIGEIYGPVSLDEGYSLIKLLEKRQVSEPVFGTNGIDTLKAIQRLKEDKYSKLLINNSVDFANELNIEINEEVLNNIPTTSINSYLIRVMGFGGTLPAVPLSTPFTEWYQYFMNQEKISL